MHFSNLFRLSYWLDPAVLDHQAGMAMWLIVALGLLWGGVGILLLRQRRSSFDIAIAQIVAGMLIAAVAIGRLFAMPVLGLRIGWLIAAFVAGVPLALRVVRQAWCDGLLADSLAALAFAATSPSPSLERRGERRDSASPLGKGGLRGVGVTAWHWSTTIAWLGLHLVGLCAVLSVIHQPLWFAPVLILAILAPVFFATRIGRTFTPHSLLPTPYAAVLAPLLLVYVMLALRLGISAVARLITGEFRVVEPFGALLNLPVALVVMMGYALAISLYQASGVKRQTSREAVKAAAVALVVGVVAWASWTALTLHTHGVSGSDPYAYAQMGVDLAERGTVFHPFPLVRLTHALNIPSDPIIHIGYKLPQDIQRVSTTVWPPGYAVFTGLAYKLVGEQGLYLITPLLSLLSLAVVWFLALSLLQNTARSAGLSPAPFQAEGGEGAGAGEGSYAIAALTVFLTATSYQQVEWQMIPMADIAAQLFSLLALALAVRVQNTEHRAQNRIGMAVHRPPSAVVLAALSGLALGVAFDIRYTQVLIAPALAYALWPHYPSPVHGVGVRVRFAPILTCAAFALIAAAPVLVYHTLAFGNPFHTGSEELANFSLARLPETLARLLGELTTPREFGLLLPLIVIGAIALWRYNRRSLLALVIYFVPLFVLHIAYAYLRPRDILPLFPVLSFLAALGAVWIVGWVHSGRTTADGRRQTNNSSGMPSAVYRQPSSTRQLVTAALLVTLAFAFVLRSMDTLLLPITRGFGAFGYLVREQRASFARVSELTPPDAVIASSLNSGAVDLHAGRMTFRPGGWRPDELLAFVRALHEENTPVFILEDGVEMAQPVATLRQHFHLDEIARLDMPYYFPGSGSENRKVALYRIDD